MKAYASGTSAPQGGQLRFHLAAVADRCAIRDAVTGEIRAERGRTEPGWTLRIPHDWPSSLYAASFGSADPDDDVYFVVRPGGPPRDAILVSVPFLTWQAYNRAGVPGEGLYHRRRRPGPAGSPSTGPAAVRRRTWEEPLLRWLRPPAYPVDYCSNLDLHQDPAS